MEKAPKINFGLFTLDAAYELLWKGLERIHLRPKSHALLQYLAVQPGRLATKDELMNAIWRDCHVGDEALRHCMAEIRRALSNKAEAPKVVETVHRRGYRFIAKSGRQTQGVRQPRAHLQNQNQEPVLNSHQLVGRDSELTQLQQYLVEAKQGEHNTIFVEGEQGIGSASRESHGRSCGSCQLKTGMKKSES